MIVFICAALMVIASILMLYFLFRIDQHWVNKYNELVVRSNALLDDNKNFFKEYTIVLEKHNDLVVKYNAVIKQIPVSTFVEKIKKTQLN